MKTKQQIEDEIAILKELQTPAMKIHQTTADIFETEGKITALKWVLK